MGNRIGSGIFGVTLALSLTSGAALASDEDVCNALVTMFERLDENLIKWQDNGHSERLSLIMQSTKIGMARAWAGDEGWPEDFVATLDSMGIVGLDEAEPRLSSEEIPKFMVTQAISLLETMGEKCPGTEFADITRFAE